MSELNKRLKYKENMMTKYCIIETSITKYYVEASSKEEAEQKIIDGDQSVDMGDSEINLEVVVQ